MSPKRKNKNSVEMFGPSPNVPDPLHDTFHSLEQAEKLRVAGDLAGARTICEPLVRDYPDYFGALYTLGLISIDLQHFPQALGFLVRAAMLNPKSWRALTALSAVYLELEASEMAAHSLEQATAIKPDDPSILITLGEIYSQEREYELARDAFAKSFELDPTLEAAAIGLGACYGHLGQYRQAASLFEGLFKRGSCSIGVLAELNNLPSAFVTVDMTSRLKRVKRDSKHPVTEFNNSMAFVSAAVMDRAGRPADAWQHLVRANQGLAKDLQQATRELVGTQRVNLAQLKVRTVQIKGLGGGKTPAMSLFILGPSRSGKTTMETLIGSLEDVKRGYENPGVENAIRRSFQSAGLLTSSLFEVMPPKLDAECRALYIDELALRAGVAKVFTNTHPGRIHDAARVASAFPNVRFIFVKRNIEDNMLRIFMRKYYVGNPYAYDLKQIRAHLDWYHEIIDVLADKLGDITRVVRYEDMVANPSGTLSSMAEFCGLAMTGRPLPPIGNDSGCAEPYRDMISKALKD